MDTPICDFVRAYVQRKDLRLHMPGHKGKPLLGMEPLDITEISGADSLYEAAGIIAQSEENASKLFGCRTFYSTEGASQCIRAMMYLVLQWAKQQGRKPLVAAGRNAHKAFLTGVALLGLEVDWLYPAENPSYLTCNLQPGELETYFKTADRLPAAVYLTSPDYLGNLTDIAALAEVCHRYGVLLTVDNAHGAYLKFLPDSLHPMDLGADLCCDSAHKTLPALTGGAYLHLSDKMDAELGGQVKNAMAIFGSTSPSYLILQSLDAVNLYLETFARELTAYLPVIRQLKAKLTDLGYTLYGTEPLKITVCAGTYGYTGLQLAEHLRSYGIEPEFADPDYLVLMLTPELPADAPEQIIRGLCALPKREMRKSAVPQLIPGKTCLSVRDAMLSDSEILPVDRCLGRVLAVPTVGCPPAVPILVCGEQITEHAIECFSYYGISHCCVVKE